jgi:hypothetical protein
MQSLTDDVLTLLQILFLFYDRVTVASDRNFTSSFSFSATGSIPAYRSTAVEAALRLPHRRPPLVCSPSDPLLWSRMAAPTSTPIDSLTIPNPVATVRDHHLATQRHDHHHPRSSPDDTEARLPPFATVAQRRSGAPHPLVTLHAPRSTTTATWMVGRPNHRAGRATNPLFY